MLKHKTHISVGPFYSRFSVMSFWIPFVMYIGVVIILYLYSPGTLDILGSSVISVAGSISEQLSESSISARRNTYLVTSLLIIALPIHLTVISINYFIFSADYARLREEISRNQAMYVKDFQKVLSTFFLSGAFSIVMILSMTRKSILILDKPFSFLSTVLVCYIVIGALVSILKYIPLLRNR